jgi:hypothetical protein
MLALSDIRKLSTCNDTTHHGWPSRTTTLVGEAKLERYGSISGAISDPLSIRDCSVRQCKT